MDRDAKTMTAVGTSVADRIKSTARNTGRDTQFLLKKFAIERLLVRLNESSHAGAYCVKGGMVMLLVGGNMHRPTDDLDFTSLKAFDFSELKDVFRELAAAAPRDEDGLTYELDDGRSQVMREEEVNPGIRLILSAHLHTVNGRTPIQVKIDAAYGDPITPASRMARLPQTVKGFEPPELPVYPWETVLAEKIHGICKHAETNTRLKDYYDIIAIIRSVPLDGEILSGAVQITFAVRNSAELVAEPFGLTREFASTREAGWKRFMATRGIGTTIPSMSDAVDEVRRFAAPLLDALSRDAALELTWEPGTGWIAKGPRPVSD